MFEILKLVTILILSIIDAEEFVIPNNEFSIWIYYCLDDKYQDDMSEMKHTLYTLNIITSYNKIRESLSFYWAQNRIKNGLINSDCLQKPFFVVFLITILKELHFLQNS